MTHFSDPLHADPCRRCKGIFRRDLMTPARTVLRNPKARGRYCAACARIMAPGTRLPER